MKNAENLEHDKKRLLQVFRYLQALNQLKNPVPIDINTQPWLLWFRDMPEHPTIRRGNVEGNTPDGVSSADDYIVKVGRPELSDPPTPPAQLLPWLEKGWQEVKGSLKIIPQKQEEITPKTIHVDDEPAETLLESEKALIIRFEDDPERPRLLDEWTPKYEAWVSKERPVRQAMTIFTKLYDLYARLEREPEQVELVLGDGLLDWEGSAAGRLYHPMLLLRLRIDFDPTLPEFTVSEGDKPTELYSALLRLIPDVPARSISGLQEDLDHGAWHPLGGEDTSEFLKRLVTQLSPYGDLTPVHSKTKQDIPTVHREPLLFLRKRTLGYSQALEAILEDIPGRNDLPDFLKNIVGIATETCSDKDIERTPTGLDPNGEDENILLSKEANGEQLQIAQRLDQHGAVLVQGPPGTGKTHTIANLIGHLLAQGKSILVTSHTSKALQVLRDKVVKPLQPLCISQITDDSRGQMDRAIDAITERLSISNADVLEREAEQIQTQRLALIRQIRETRHKLLLARQDEYRSIVVAGKDYPPSEAARLVKDTKDVDDWIPGPVSLGAPLPLSSTELAELYRTNVALSIDDERELHTELPEPGKLQTPIEFERFVAENKNVNSTGISDRPELWSAGDQLTNPKDLEYLSERLLKAVEVLNTRDPWRLDALEAGLDGGVARDSWQNLISLVEQVSRQALEAKELLFEWGPILPTDLSIEDTEKVLVEVLDYFQEKAKLTGFKLWTKPQWKAFIETARVAGKPPTEKRHFDALRVVLELTKARTKLIERWQRQVTVLGGPGRDELGATPENVCQQLVYALRQGLDWATTHWDPLLEELKRFGFDWELFLTHVPIRGGEHGRVLRIHDLVKGELTQILLAHAIDCHKLQLQHKLEELKAVVKSTDTQETQVTVVSSLYDALSGLNAYTYKRAYHRLIELTTQREDLGLRHTLLAKLEHVAPNWSSYIRARADLHGKGIPPGNPMNAWLWRQLQDELDQRARTSMEELQASITQLSEDLRRTTALLVEKKSWAAQVRRTTLTQRQALQGWKEIMHRIGKGTGKRVPRFLAEARKLMPICQSAVPVWIMPLNRVTENFNPKTNHFDVVIIDEASQADAMALTTLYLGSQVVIVGDHEQVSPVGVGQNQDDIQKLIDGHLRGIPNSQLYDGLFSIYNLGMTTFEPICLREHFRCVSPIIQFSNFLSYNGKIIPLRDESEVQLKPFTVAYRVEGATTRGKTNDKEAHAIVSLILACIENPIYKEASIGVISLVGEEQAMLIDSLLQTYLSPSEYTRRHIQCGNPAHFQGDERDVIFLSVVDAPTGNGPLTLKREGAHDMYKKRFNVGASRARDQLWVVHSVDPDADLKVGDIRRELIKHAQDPYAVTKGLEQLETKTESEFERQVLRQLVHKGFRVTPQWPVGAFRIDMVIEGNGKRLAVECDGDRYHTLHHLVEDMSRQAILERLGWRFVRIRGSEFFRDPEETMRPVFERLQVLDIPAEGTKVAEVPVQTCESLDTAIVRRAAEIRRAWNVQLPLSDLSLYGKM
ncbi:MAG TPA: AAA domain-containing protein [Desulfosporosinus sp.]